MREGVWEPASRCGTAFWEGLSEEPSIASKGRGARGWSCALMRKLPSADVIGGDSGLVHPKIELAVACMCELRRLNIDSIKQTRSIQACRVFAVTSSRVSSTTAVVGSSRPGRVDSCAVVIQTRPFIPVRVPRNARYIAAAGRCD